MTRVTKHSSQTFNINTRNLWWCVSVCNIAVEVILTCNRSELMCFFYHLFVYSCPTSLGQTFDLFSFLGKQMVIFLGTLYTVRKVTFWA